MQMVPWTLPILPIWTSSIIRYGSWRPSSAVIATLAPKLIAPPLIVFFVTVTHGANSPQFRWQIRSVVYSLPANTPRNYVIPMNFHVRKKANGCAYGERNRRRAVFCLQSSPISRGTCSLNFLNSKVRIWKQKGKIDYFLESLISWYEYFHPIAIGSEK